VIDERQSSVREEEQSDPARIFALHASFCRIFGDEKRLKIMWFLADQERTVGEIAGHLEVSMPNASQQLRVLRDKGAVTYRKEGQTVYYRISNPKFLVGCQLIREGLIEELKRRGDLVHGRD
jgi:ArsR family transcriptional regulator, virulence genes transcriptional regulator